jgi:hypothetical protein
LLVDGLVYEKLLNPNSNQVVEEDELKPWHWHLFWREWYTHLGVAKWGFGHSHPYFIGECQVQAGGMPSWLLRTPSLVKPLT